MSNAGGQKRLKTCQARGNELLSQFVRLALISLATGNICLASNEREVRGRVVDEAGQPVAGVDVSFWWRANGPFGRDENGNLSDHLDTPEGQRIFSTNLRRPRFRFSEELFEDRRFDGFDKVFIEAHLLRAEFVLLLAPAG